MARSPARSVRALALTGLAALAACATAPKPTPPAAPPALAPVASVTASASALPAVASASSAPVQLQPTLDPAQAKLCTEDELRAARDEFRSIHQAMARNVVDEVTAKLQRDRTTHLLGSPCYGGRSLMPTFDIEELSTAAGVQFKAWWRHGGETFVTGPLSHANAAYFAPSLPKVLAPETLAASDPLRAIVCPSSDAVCDPLAEGARLDLNREIERVAGPHVQEPHRSASARAAEACAREASLAPANDRLGKFLSCVDSIEPARTELPVAHYRSPKGWLVMRGRRGHYSFCDEIRAYDLATGAAYIASRCGGLVLENNGSVNHGKTSQQSQTQTRAGTLSVDSLRRLALMLWLQDSLVENRTPYARYPLPESIPMPDPTESRGMSSGSFRGGWGSSAQTDIAFSLVDGGQVLRAGTFTWPDSSDTADQIIDDLLVATEATFQPGCPPATLPANLTQARAFGGVSSLDASVESLRASADALGKAMADLKTGDGCGK